MTNPTLPPNANGLVLNILHFDKIVSLDECGLLYREVYNPQFDAYDAITNVNVDLKTFSNMFCFETDHIDVNDVSSLDVKYYVLANKIQRFIPELGNSIVNTNPIVSFSSNGSTEPNQIVGKDFTRYLASLLFNTPYGTDLFINESALVDSVSSALSTAWSYCITDLQNVSNESTNQSIPLVGNAPAKYLTNEFSGVQNICRELFLQLISKAPSRFTDLPQIQVEDANSALIREAINLNYYYLPFVHNDTIQIRVKVYPCEHQPTFGLSTTDTTKFETVGNNTHLKGRTYLINMILTDTSTPIPIPANTFSFQVVGKNATISQADVLSYLPIIQDANIMQITPTANQINAKTVRVDIAYTLSPTATSAELLTVGVGFSNVRSWYNSNIASIDIKQFGGIPLYGIQSQFQELSSLITFTSPDAPLISPGTSLKCAFSSMSNFNENVDFLNNWNLSNVVSMEEMFIDCTLFNNGSTQNDGLHPLSFTTSSNLLLLSHMFERCINFNQTVFISDTTNLIMADLMFFNCILFNNGDTTNIRTKPITWYSPNLSEVGLMFGNCISFNQTVVLSISPTVETYTMFDGCTLLQ